MALRFTNFTFPKSTVKPFLVITVGPPAPLNIGTVEVGKMEQLAFPFKVIAVRILSLTAFQVLPSLKMIPGLKLLLHTATGCEWPRMGSMLNNMSNINL